MTPPYPTPTLNHLPLRERPAYRVAHAGPGACAVHELLAAVIGGQDQVGIAMALLSQYGGLTELSRLTVEELAQWNGIGPSRAAALHAALELGRRMQIERSGEKPLINSPPAAAALLMPWIGHEDQEHFVVLLLDTRNRVVGQEVLYKGTLNASHIRVAEAFRQAISVNAASVVFAHNHPSSDCGPSNEDIACCRRLVEAGDTLDIEAIDFLIVSAQSYVSLRQRGLGGFTQ